MEICHGLAAAPRGGPATHLAVGMFDGVHLGHQAVIEAAGHQARRDGGKAGVLTFAPHPSRLFRPDAPTLLIQPLDEKLRRLAALGLDFTVVQPFDRDFAAVPAPDFPGMLKNALPELSGVYIGENFRFGRGRQGDVETLIEGFRPLGVDVVSAARLRQNGEPISSTRIRESLRAGDLSSANRLLGYPYTSTGEVIGGRRLGRTIGFPTLNLAWEPELRPAFGVYAVRFRRLPDRSPGDGQATLLTDGLRRGVANYGFRPTVEAESSEARPLLEIHSLDPADDLGPGDTLETHWLSYLRAEQRFASLDDLKAQIAHDVAAAEQSFSRG
ncbi:MAG: riboflavin biosynthesis protein RibF [Opitutales bacterium]